MQLLIISFIVFLFHTVYPYPSIPPTSTTNKVLDFQTFIIPTTALSKYATIFMKYFDTRRCTEANLASLEMCSRLSSIPWTNINIYVGYDKRTDFQNGDTESEKGQLTPTFTYTALELSPNLISKKVQERGERRQKVIPVIPDSSNVKTSSEHDIVFVVDPYPEYNFGHFLGLFYVDIDVDEEKCQLKSQVYLKDRTCISAAKKPRCDDLSEENLKRFQHSAKCSMDFLPTIKRAGNFRSNSTENLLHCINLPEFRSCPKTELADEESSTVENEPTIGHPEVRTRCRLFQRCDRAILLGGGWNQHHSTQTSEQNLVKMEFMLITNGFLKENIKTFYGNGENINDRTNSSRKIYSIVKKSEVRRHISKTCKTKHCADTFFIYLNLPMTSNGNFVLWDVNQNGLIDDQELYTNDEFLSDIAHCEAQRVIVVSDQRRGDILLSLLQKSTIHPNILLSVAGLSDQPTRNGELTSIWANHSHPSACLKHIHQAASVWMKDSIPSIFDTSGGNLLNLSISGAPCGDQYSRELRIHYQGCQNLPTSIWFGSLVNSEMGGSSNGDDVGGTSEGNQVREVTYDSNVSYSRRFS